MKIVESIENMKDRTYVDCSISDAKYMQIVRYILHILSGGGVI